MNIWAVFLPEEGLSEDAYESGLMLVDDESRTRIKRFYHKKDSYRCLLGRLLPRLLLRQHGVLVKEAELSRTSTGKPYVSTPHLERTVGFNVSHDNEYVVMAFQTVALDAEKESSIQSKLEPQTKKKVVMDVTNIGIDVMKVALPRFEKSFPSFVQSISDTLTTLEQRTLLEISDPNDALQRLYLVWTLKEAYTKALGLGLGFDFKRIEVDVNGHKITVDNNVPCGWEFIAFMLKAPSGAIYQVAAARQSTQASSALDGHVEFRGVVDTSSDSDLSKWFRHYYAAPFISSCTADK